MRWGGICLCFVDLRLSCLRMLMILTYDLDSCIVVIVFDVCIVVGILLLLWIPIDFGLVDVFTWVLLPILVSFAYWSGFGV